MSEMHIECPHCGTKFKVQVDGDFSNMMVFPCARCQTPLMCYHGEISELDREEFTKLRQRLSKVLDVVMRQDGTVGEVANSLKKLVDVSNSRAAEREQEEHPSITDDVLDVLQKDLDEMDVDAFLSKL
jgi:DNA-directed RNA polymerase subunit RPC12/RpoP